MTICLRYLADVLCGLRRSLPATYPARTTDKTSIGARRPDQGLDDALMGIREDGRVPWDWIVDETRQSTTTPGARASSRVCLIACPIPRSIRGAAERGQLMRMYSAGS